MNEIIYVKNFLIYKDMQTHTEILSYTLLNIQTHTHTDSWGFEEEVFPNYKMLGTFNCSQRGAIGNFDGTIKSMFKKISLMRRRDRGVSSEKRRKIQEIRIPEVRWLGAKQGGFCKDGKEVTWVQFTNRRRKKRKQADDTKFKTLVLVEAGTKCLFYFMFICTMM